MENLVDLGKYRLTKKHEKTLLEIKRLLEMIASFRKELTKHNKYLMMARLYKELGEYIEKLEAIQMVEIANFKRKMEEE